MLFHLVKKEFLIVKKYVLIMLIAAILIPSVMRWRTPGLAGGRGDGIDARQYGRGEGTVVRDACQKSVDKAGAVGRVRFVGPGFHRHAVHQEIPRAKGKRLAIDAGVLRADSGDGNGNFLRSGLRGGRRQTGRRSRWGKRGRGRSWRRGRRRRGAGRFWLRGRRSAGGEIGRFRRDCGRAFAILLLFGQDIARCFQRGHGRSLCRSRGGRRQTGLRLFRRQRGRRAGHEGQQEGQQQASVELYPLHGSNHPSCLYGYAMRTIGRMP